MKIINVSAVPISFPVPAEHSVTLGIGRSVKRDAVLVQVQTDEGLTGWGEAHHGRCPGAIAKLLETTMKELIVGMNPLDTVSVGSKIYRMQIASHGMGAAAALAWSGIDLALWDIRCQVAGRPVCEMLGGSARPIKAYAGGISLGWQEPASLADEAMRHVSHGYKALKLRVGDTPKRDIERVTAVREAVGDSVELLVDANTAYTLEQAREVMPAYRDLRVGWLEEPFPAQDHYSYDMCGRFATVPLAAGENHYTRYEFESLLNSRTVGFVQPDLSKTGGLSESMRIAAMASAKKISVNPHTSATAINMACSIHFLCALDNPGYFEADVTALNLFRDQLSSVPPYELDEHGCVRPPTGQGTGLELDLDFIARYPLIDGPCYV